MMLSKVKSLSRVQLLATPLTVLQDPSFKNKIRDNKVSGSRWLMVTLLSKLLRKRFLKLPSHPTAFAQEVKMSESWSGVEGRSWVLCDEGLENKSMSPKDPRGICPFTFHLLPSCIPKWIPSQATSGPEQTPILSLLSSMV